MPDPRLGVRVRAGGVDVAVHAPAATALELCLRTDGAPERRVPLRGRAGPVWHGFVPDVAPGTRYALRADGPFDPARGHRFDPAKVLLDPYARALDGAFHWGRRHATRGADTAEVTPWGVVVEDLPPAARGPRRAPSERVVYELHVRGFTRAHPGVPAGLRGTYAGLAHPAALEHLVGLGVTTVELLPVQAFVAEPHLQRGGRTNYWGYNTLGFFAPHPHYASEPGAAVAEFRAMVDALHAAGLEVLLDVVYNHTAEGGADGPTLSLRGLADGDYYRLDPDGGYVDVTGCGNTLDTSRPAALRLVLDSLRYWVGQLGVDGFRFDLASALARDRDGRYDAQGTFLAALAQDPALTDVALIAEPWDATGDGYRVGGFPTPWAEWNGRYRDTVRDVWRPHAHPPAHLRGDLARALAGSAELYEAAHRAPWASVDFVTSHDGFALADLVSYDHRHNEANGEHNRDGERDNRSWNGGVEGRSDDPAVLAGRRARRRALLTTLLLSTGTPMLRAGDELGASQGGNNNAYCQDDETSWLDWAMLGNGWPAGDPAGADPALPGLVRRLLALRAAHPVLRRTTFFRGGPAPRDVTWYSPAGREIADADWAAAADGSPPTLGMLLDGTVTGDARTGPDATFLLWFHPGPEATSVALPAGDYLLLIDTAADEPVRPGEPVTDRLRLGPWSVAVLTNAGTTAAG